MQEKEEAEDGVSRQSISLPPRPTFAFRFLLGGLLERDNDLFLDRERDLLFEHVRDWLPVLL